MALCQADSSFWRKFWLCVNMALSVFCILKKSILKYVFDILVFEILFKAYLVFSISNTL